MTLDRTGEPLDGHDQTTCPKWLGEDDEGRPIPCLRCKPHLATPHASHDLAERQPSARAQAAIDQENRNA